MIEKKQRKNGMHYFTVKASNGQILVVSGDYNSEAGRDNCIESLKSVIQKEINR